MEAFPGQNHPTLSVPPALGMAVYVELSAPKIIVPYSAVSPEEPALSGAFTANFFLINRR